ncbi:hypothetical protein H5410_037959 [Solanum commersonii]|uniref:MATH domain-containing protein n=1 Tax=Solanum commersonii TaxID=4109 RepID=A0A9J5Y9Y2_SOLCO|nr:hypothetical protein H5410_037959 [Solanum commersonii]
MEPIVFCSPSNMEYIDLHCPSNIESVVLEDEAAELMMEIRDASPTHYSLKIESFSLLSESGIDKFESSVFNAGGYKWKMIIYPNGNTRENGSGHISVYLAITGLNSMRAGWEVNAIFTFFVFNQLRDNYLSVRGKMRRFQPMKTLWGLPKFLSNKTFKYPSNGYLVDDKCVFGAEIFIIHRQAIGECLSMVKSNDLFKRQWKICNFSKLRKDWLSEKFTVGGYNWKLLVYPQGNVTSKGCHISIYLKFVNAKDFNQHQKVKANCSINLKDQINGGCKKLSYCEWFSSTAPTWGFSGYMPLTQLYDEKNGYLVKDCIVVEVDLKVVFKHSLGEANIPIHYFYMVEDGRYQQYPWGHIAFSKLIKSLRQEFTKEKKMYQLAGMPYVLNVWIYECATAVSDEIAVKVGSFIPRICNWRVVGVKPKFGMFMSSIFSQNSYNDIYPTSEEMASLDLPGNIDASHSEHQNLAAKSKPVQPQELPGFEGFSTNPTDQFLRRSRRVSTTSSTPPPKRKKNAHPIKSDVIDINQPEQLVVQSNKIIQFQFQIDKKFQHLKDLIKLNHKQLMNVVRNPHKQKEENISGTSTSPTMPEFNQEDHVVRPPTTNQLFDKWSSSIVMDMPNNDRFEDVDTCKEKEGRKDVSDLPHTTEVHDEVNVHKQDNEDVPVGGSKIFHQVMLDEHDADKVKDNVIKFDKSGSTNLDSVSAGTQEAIGQLVTMYTNVNEIVVHEVSKTFVQRLRLLSKIFQSPYVTIFGFSVKGKEKVDSELHIRLNHPFQGYGIIFQPSSALLDQYHQWLSKGLLKTHDKNPVDDNLSTQEHMARGSVVSGFERSLINIINGFEIPVGLSWHSCDDVYILMNCDGQFHWVLAVVVLKKRLIRVYNSAYGSRRKIYSEDIEKLSLMLPTYLQDSGFYEHSERTDWSSLDAYKDKETGSLLEPKHHFLVEYVQDLFNKEATHSLLWNYSSEKAEAGYVSDNDDPSKPRDNFAPPNHDALVNLE